MINEHECIFALTKLKIISFLLFTLLLKIFQDFHVTHFSSVNVKKAFDNITLSELTTSGKHACKLNFCASLIFLLGLSKFDNFYEGCFSNHVLENFGK